MTHETAYQALQRIEELLQYAASDVQDAVHETTESGDPKPYFNALQRLDVATRSAVQATTALANIVNIQTAMVREIQSQGKAAK